MSKIHKIAALISLCYLAPASAGGLYLYEIATDDVGLSAAGTAARAQDASVLASNPAGLSHVKGKSFTAGLQGLYGDADYKLDNGKDAGNVIGFVPVASAFYSQQYNEKLTFGIGLYGNFGLGLDYDELSAVDEVTLQSLTIQPTISYQVNDAWSVGLGLGINYGIFDYQSDISSEIDDQDLAFNIKIGTLYQYSDDTRFGLAYTSRTKFDFDKNLDRLPIEFDATVNAPQQVMFSAFHQINADWAIMGNLGWQDWSDYGDSQASLGNNALPTSSKLQDTYHVALGAQYTVSPDLTWNMGVAYDSSIFRDQNNGSLTLPSGNAVRLGTGFRYQLDKQQSIGAAFSATLLDSSEVQGNFAGKYDRPNIYFLMVNYSWHLE